MSSFTLHSWSLQKGHFSKISILYITQMSVCQSLKEARFFTSTRSHNCCCKTLDVLFSDLEGHFGTAANHDLILAAGLTSWKQKYYVSHNFVLDNGMKLDLYFVSYEHSVILFNYYKIDFTGNKRKLHLHLYMLR